MLVKVINTGTEGMNLIHAGKLYRLDANGGELIIEEGIAKHWFGDWSLVDEDAVLAENKRITMLHKNFPNPNITLKITKLREIVRTEKELMHEAEPKPVNPYLEAPKENEFEDLRKLETMRDVDTDEPMDWSERNKQEQEAEREAIARKKAASKR